MIFNGFIGSWECIATLGCITITPLVLTLPTFASEDFGTSAFLHAIYVSIIAGIFFLLLFMMYSKFKNKDIIDISEFALGKFFKYLTGLILIFYFFSTAVLTLGEFNENIKNILFSEAPSEIICLLFMITVFIGSVIGLRGLFRTSAIIVPIIIIGFLAIVASLFSRIDLTNFTPIFGNGIKEFFLNGTFRFGRYEGMILLLLIGPNIKKIGSTALKSFIIITLFILISFFLIFGIIQYPSITENFFPLFEISRLVSYGNFIERIESIFILIWLVAAFIYLSIDICLVVNILKKIFNIKYYNRITPAISIIALSTSLLISSFIDILMLRRALSVFIAPIILFIYPFIILLISTIKHRNSLKE